MVNNVFAYGPDGKVFFAAINFPGSWADGSLTARFLGHLKAKIGEYKICVDQGFPRSGDAYGTLVGPVTKRATKRLHRDVRDYLLRISNVRTSLRQASEWGMHGLQGTFPRCKKRLPSDSEQVWCLSRLCLYTIFVRSTLGSTVRLKMYLTLNMFYRCCSLPWSCLHDPPSLRGLPSLPSSFPSSLHGVFCDASSPSSRLFSLGAHICPCFS